MADGLLLTLAVEGEEAGAPFDRHAADAFVVELVDGLNRIDAVLAAPARRGPGQATSRSAPCWWGCSPPR